MISRNLKVVRYAGIFLSIAALCSVLFYPILRGESAPPAVDDLQKQMEAVKAELQSKGETPALLNQYSRLANILSKCDVISQVTEPTISAPFIPAASLCLNGSLAAGDPTMTRINSVSTGTGFGACTLSGSTPRYDSYSFNLTGCAAFPTEVTITTCGPVGCQHLGSVDTVLYLYRNVAAGDPLTANGGLPGVFNPASPCTNLRALQDDLGTTVGATNNPGGSTCNQVVGANCVAPCTSPSNAGPLSGMRRQIGNGRFTVVVGHFNTAGTGNYNLYVNVPAGGCAIALAPSAAQAAISGRVVTASGQGISKATLTLSGGNLSEAVVLRTNAFGYYTFEGVEVGSSYVLTISDKRYTFTNPTRVITLEDNIDDADFVSEQ